MLEGRVGDGVFDSWFVIISEARDVQKGSHAFTSYVLMITRWQLSLLFQFCSHIILMQMSDYTTLACY